MRTPPFSERYGITKPPVMRLDAFDREARIAVWNVIHGAFFASAHHAGMFDYQTGPLAEELWTRVFRRATHLLPGVGECEHELFAQFLDMSWFEAMNAVERVADTTWRAARINLCTLFNDEFEEHSMPYRFVTSVLTRLTEPEQVAEVERALQVAQKATIAGARTHLASALEKLGERPKPDERNAIKEAISAVEVVVRKIAGDGNTLGAALKRIDVDMNPALRAGLDKLYGYTSDEGGIRHALMDDSSLQVEDARFMVVTCSAFVNYLVAKADRAGVAF